MALSRDHLFLHGPRLHTTGHVTVNGVSLYYELEGHGPPLILAMGGPGVEHGLFHEGGAFSRLSGFRQVVYYDQRGRGESERVEFRKDYEGYTIDQDVEDLDALRAALGFETFALVGYSYGGIMGLPYAGRYPERVEKLILYATLPTYASIERDLTAIWGEWKLMSEEQRKEIDDLLGSPLSDAARDEAIADIIFTQYEGGVKLPQLKKYSWNMEVFHKIFGLDRFAYGPAFRLGGDVLSYDATPLFPKITMPTLILAGELDPFVKASHEIHAGLPHAELVVLPDCGHMAHITRPDAFEAAIRGFLQK